MHKHFCFSDKHHKVVLEVPTHVKEHKHVHTIYKIVKVPSKKEKRSHDEHHVSGEIKVAPITHNHKFDGTAKIEHSGKFQHQHLHKHHHIGELKVSPVKHQHHFDGKAKVEHGGKIEQKHHHHVDNHHGKLRIAPINHYTEADENYHGKIRIAPISHYTEADDSYGYYSEPDHDHEGAADTSSSQMGIRQYNYEDEPEHASTEHITNRASLHDFNPLRSSATFGLEDIGAAYGGLLYEPVSANSHQYKVYENPGY